MYKPVDVISVSIWGEAVGAVSLDPASGYYVFEYNRAWQKRSIELAPFTMPVNQSQFVFPSLSQITYRRLPAMLADALPDNFGNALIDAYLAKEGIPKNAITELDRLAYMGTRGMGALEFKPERGPKAKTPTAIEISELVISARQALSGNFATDKQSQAALMNLIRVGTSAGGARAKAIIAWNPITEDICSGQLEAPPGFEYWLLKFDGIGSDLELGPGNHYGRVEYAYYLMALAAGITMGESRLFKENRRAHFMTCRFDRANGKKIHIQTLCAISHLDFNQRATHDYSQFFETIRSLHLPEEDLVEGFRRMVFNVVAANCDDHTKNLSFMMFPDGEWRLSPAYDVTFAYNPLGRWTHQHLMSVNGKFNNIDIDDIMLAGERYGIPMKKDVFKKVRDAVKRWPEFANEAGLNKAEIKRIQSNFLIK